LVIFVSVVTVRIGMHFETLASVEVYF
jgi:hypothetical protein